MLIINKYGLAFTNTNANEEQVGMKKNLLVIAALLISAFVQAQQEIKIDEPDKHVGDSVTVCTKIYGGIYPDRSKGTPAFLNAGNIKLYKDKPEIVVYEERQITIK